MFASKTVNWSRIGRPLILALVSGAFASSGALSQNRQNAASNCELETLGTGKVRRVIDGRTFHLDDGQHVRLAAIEVPSLPLPGETRPPSHAGVAAKTALETLLAGRTVTLKKLGPNADRYGRIVALITIEGHESSVQHAMLMKGHALVAAEVGVPACSAELFAAERSARANSLGLWGISYYVVQKAENPTKVLAERGRFSLVEGKVLSVRESRGTIYINFGRRWSEDFTVTIAKRNERAFAAAGMAPKRLAGRHVRVRGTIEERGGPWIEATRPQQIELIEQN